VRKLDRKAALIYECSDIYGQISEAKSYVPPRFYRKSCRTVYKEFKKELRKITLFHQNTSVPEAKPSGEATSQA